LNLHEANTADEVRFRAVMLDEAGLPCCAAITVCASVKLSIVMVVAIAEDTLKGAARAIAAIVARSGRAMFASENFALLKPARCHLRIGEPMLCPAMCSDVLIDH
jgi:hypothetical protein